MKFNYYYNQVPGQGEQRNNLIYTSLMSEDQKTFVQWYYNDTEYHQGQNEVVDPSKMEEKWLREVNYLTQMRNNYPDLVPKIINIDFDSRKITKRGGKGEVAEEFDSDNPIMNMLENFRTHSSDVNWDLIFRLYSDAILAMGRTR